VIPLTVTPADTLAKLARISHTHVVGWIPADQGNDEVIQFIGKRRIQLLD
jgi:hypothetical protein